MTRPASELDAEIQKTEARLAELQAQREALGEVDLSREVSALIFQMAQRLKWDGWHYSTLKRDQGEELVAAALRRGRELQREAQPALTPPRFSVPEGQTPLDDNLRHKLLDVIREGMDAFDSKAQSTYHGHSLEHCLHGCGWVIRDLRLTLDAAQTRLAALTQPPHAGKGVEHG